MSIIASNASLRGKMLFDVLIFLDQALIGSVFIFLSLLQLQVQLFFNLWSLSGFSKNSQLSVNLLHSCIKDDSEPREEEEDEENFSGHRDSMMNMNAG